MPEVSRENAPIPDSSRVVRPQDVKNVSGANGAAVVAEAPVVTIEAAAAPVDPPVFETEKRFTLSKPIATPSRTITEVVLRMPTGEDLFSINGFPTRTLWRDGGMIVEMDGEKFKAWVERLAPGIGALSLAKMSARDLRTIYEWLNTELMAAGN